MTQAFRSGGGATQYVKGGLNGDCLSHSHRQFKQGFDDRRDNKELVRHPSKPYQSGVAAYDRQELVWQQAKQLNRLMIKSGLSKADLLHLKAIQKNQVF